MDNVPKFTNKSWPLLFIAGGCAITAGISQARADQPAAATLLIAIGCISFGAWLVTEILSLVSSTERKEENGQSSTGQDGDDSVQEER